MKIGICKAMCLRLGIIKVPCTPRRMRRAPQNDSAATTVDCPSVLPYYSSDDLALSFHRTSLDGRLPIEIGTWIRLVRPGRN
jgi:hypothetical protein